MNKLYVMIGVPGSGKSTYVDKMLKLKPDLKIVSRDAIRFSMLAENDEYFSKENDVFKEFIYQIVKFLNEGYDVVADATHISFKSRAKLFNALKIDKEKTEVIGIVMRTPLVECIRRNENRKGTRTYVPISEIRSMSFSLEEPTLDEYNRIFDRIYTIFTDWL